MNTNKENKNPYGHLLDKYLDSTHLDWKTRQQREKEAETRYGNLLDKAKPDFSMLNLMVKMEDNRIERQKKMEEDKKLESLRWQMRIEAEKRKAEEHDTEVRNYAESIMARKEEKRMAAEKKMAEKREAEERQKEIYDRIDSLMKISPGAADAYIWAMKEANAI